MHLSDEQIIAIRCAHADLVGALQARDALDLFAHDWKAHQISIVDLEYHFPFLTGEP